MTPGRLSKGWTAIPISSSAASKGRPFAERIALRRYRQKHVGKSAAAFASQRNRRYGARYATVAKNARIRASQSFVPTLV
ncbi:MAG: hypothetical protein J0H63_06615, partial [Rhizobiales bacterium]|nr:hypothetical protein [Hyphomicrobiales bacterium]